MQVRATFTEKQPEYKYFKLENGKADVFILKFVDEETDEETGQVSFIYIQNEFRINQNEITEEMIKKNPMDYLDYSGDNEKIPLEERVSAMEDAVMELSEVIFNG